MDVVNAGYSKFLLTHPVWDVTSRWRIILCWQKFLLTHPVWDVTLSSLVWGTTRRFLLTHPVWDVTCNFNCCCSNDNISTHTSRVGCDDLTQQEFANKLGFLLTHPVWDVTRSYSQTSSEATISTHTSRVGCDLTCRNWCLFFRISTHTSRVGCDSETITHVDTANDFYSHIPCGMWLTAVNLFPLLSYFYSHIPCGMWRLGNIFKC